MQVLSTISGGKWLQTKDVGSGGGQGNERDSAQEEIKRVLSDCFRCNNLVVLTGLGTSLHVNIDKDLSNITDVRQPVDTKKIAPMMSDLWRKAKENCGVNFDQVLRKR